MAISALLLQFFFFQTFSLEWLARFLQTPVSADPAFFSALRFSVTVNSVNSPVDRCEPLHCVCVGSFWREIGSVHARTSEFFS